MPSLEDIGTFSNCGDHFSPALSFLVTRLVICCIFSRLGIFESSLAHEYQLLLFSVSSSFRYCFIFLFQVLKSTQILLIFFVFSIVPFDLLLFFFIANSYFLSFCSKFCFLHHKNFEFIFFQLVFQVLLFMFTVSTRHLPGRFIEIGDNC